MVLDDAAAEDDHTAALGLQGAVIQQTDVLHEVNDKARLAPCVEVDDVSEGPVGERRAENGDLVLPAPVVDAVLVVNFLAHASYDLGRRENCALLFLFPEHLLHQGQEPLLKQDVVVVWHDQVANAVQALLAQDRALEAEVSNVARRQALHDVFLNAACRSDNLVDHFVLAEVADVLAHAARGHVGRVAEIDRAARVLALLGVLVLLLLILSDGLV